MAIVRPEDLSIGEPLSRALYTRSGRLLAHAGTVLVAEMAAAIEGAGELIADTRAEPLTRSGSGAEGGGGRLVAPDAATVEARERREWERRLIRVRAELRKAAGPLVQVARVRWEKLPRNVVVGLDPVEIRRGDVPGHGSIERIPTELDRTLRERRAAGVAALRGLWARLLDGQNADADLLFEIADDLIDAAARHPEVFPVLAVGLPRPVDSLPDHAFTTGAAAVAIAAQLGWPRSDVRAAGVAGLLCDCGMGLVPHPIRGAARALTEIELNAMRRHPEYGVALLRNIRGVPESVVLAVYQHHERADGTGYPLGIRAEQMHDYARVVAAAETFAGMTAPRSHRPGRTAHAALSEMARLAAGGVFEAAVVRALVDAMGLYPAGSFVKLSTGHVALVGASGEPGASDRPTVHVVLPEGAARRFGQAIDLRLVEPKLLRVVEAVRAPEGMGV